MEKSKKLLSECDRKFLKPALISPHLMCPICFKIFIEPMRFPCGHTFCKECIFMVKSNQASKKTCPVCRAEHKINTISLDRIANSIINDFEVYCPNQGNYCIWTGALSALPSHYETCQFYEKPKWALNCADKSESNTDIIEYHGDDQDKEIQRMNELGNQSLLSRLYLREDSKGIIETVFAENIKNHSGNGKNQEIIDVLMYELPETDDDEFENFIFPGLEAKLETKKQTDNSGKKLSELKRSRCTSIGCSSKPKATLVGSDCHQFKKELKKK